MEGGNREGSLIKKLGRKESESGKKIPPIVRLWIKTGKGDIL